MLRDPSDTLPRRRQPALATRGSTARGARCSLGLDLEQVAREPSSFPVAEHVRAAVGRAVQQRLERRRLTVVEVRRRVPQAVQRRRLEAHALERLPDPAAYERANFRMALR